MGTFFRPACNHETSDDTLSAYLVDCLDRVANKLGRLSFNRPPQRRPNCKKRSFDRYRCIAQCRLGDPNGNSSHARRPEIDAGS
jgi:hypothetical protein